MISLLWHEILWWKSINRRSKNGSKHFPQNTIYIYFSFLIFINYFDPFKNEFVLAILYPITTKQPHLSFLKTLVLVYQRVGWLICVWIIFAHWYKSAPADINPQPHLYEANHYTTTPHLTTTLRRHTTRQ